MKNAIKKGSNRGLIIVSIFIICTVAVLWRRWGGSNRSNPEGQQALRDSLFQQKRQLQYNSKVYLNAIRLANSGDIAVRLGTDMTSEMLRHLNLTDPSYSHAGIISREGDTVFVYHALGGETNPDQKIVREPLWNFGLPKSNKALGLYRFSMDSITQKRLIGIVQTFYQQQIPFDTAFDLGSKNRMYCTELVSCSFEKALGDSAIFHRSQANSKTYIAVDDLTGNRQVKKVAAWKY